MFNHTKKFQSCPFSSLVIISLLTFFLLVPCLCDHQTRDLVSCLNHHNINNFTTYPDEDFHKLLHFSTNNLRISGPLVPKPSAIIFPSTKEQLIDTVLCSKRESLEIRIRCGGHSYEGTSWVVPDKSPFIIIEMMNLDRIWVDIEEDIAWVEGGATLGQMYYKIAQTSKIHTISAGTCPTVGVGGHISGGGFGFISRKYGLVADHVVDALLIDANGRLLNREAMGEEVFWAIRGGGGGIWGIIYAWKIRLVNVPKVLTGFVLSRIAPEYDVASLVHKWQFVAPKLENDFFVMAFVRSVGNHVSAIFQGTYLGPRSEAISILRDEFLELDVIQDDFKEMNWVELITYVNGLETVSYLGNRYLKDKSYFKAKYDYVRTPIPLDGINAAVNMLEKQPKGGLFVEPFGGIMDEIASDSIAFPHRKGNIFGIEYHAYWKEEDDEKSQEYIDWVREFHKLMTPYVSSNPRASYVNCMDLDLGIMGVLNGTNNEVEMARVWGEKYFLQNYDRLVKAKTLVDPKNVFKNQQGIPPSPTISTNGLLLPVCDMRYITI